MSARPRCASAPCADTSQGEGVPSVGGQGTTPRFSAPGGPAPPPPFPGSSPRAAAGPHFTQHSYPPQAGPTPASAQDPSSNQLMRLLMHDAAGGPDAAAPPPPQDWLSPSPPAHGSGPVRWPSSNMEQHQALLHLSQGAPTHQQDAGAPWAGLPALSMGAAAAGQRRPPELHLGSQADESPLVPSSHAASPSHRALLAEGAFDGTQQQQQQQREQTPLSTSAPRRRRQVAAGAARASPQGPGGGGGGASALGSSPREQGMHTHAASTPGAGEEALGGLMHPHYTHGTLAQSSDATPTWGSGGGAGGDAGSQGEVVRGRHRAAGSRGGAGGGAAGRRSSPSPLGKRTASSTDLMSEGLDMGGGGGGGNGGNGSNLGPAASEDMDMSIGGGGGGGAWGGSGSWSGRPAVATRSGGGRASGASGGAQDLSVVMVPPQADLAFQWADLSLASGGGGGHAMRPGGAFPVDGADREAHTSGSSGAAGSGGPAPPAPRPDVVRSLAEVLISSSAALAAGGGAAAMASLMTWPPVGAQGLGGAGAAGGDAILAAAAAAAASLGMHSPSVMSPPAAAGLQLRQGSGSAQQQQPAWPSPNTGSSSHGTLPPGDLHGTPQSAFASPKGAAPAPARPGGNAPTLADLLLMQQQQQPGSGGSQGIGQPPPGRRQVVLSPQLMAELGPPTARLAGLGLMPQQPPGPSGPLSGLALGAASDAHLRAPAAAGGGGAPAPLSAGGNGGGGGESLLQRLATARAHAVTTKLLQAESSEPWPLHLLRQQAALTDPGVVGAAGAHTSSGGGAAPALTSAVAAAAAAARREGGSDSTGALPSPQGLLLDGGGGGGGGAEVSSGGGGGAASTAIRHVCLPGNGEPLPSAPQPKPSQQQQQEQEDEDMATAAPTLDQVVPLSSALRQQQQQQQQQHQQAPSGAPDAGAAPSAAVPDVVSLQAGLSAHDALLRLAASTPSPAALFNMSHVTGPGSGPGEPLSLEVWQVRAARGRPTLGRSSLFALQAATHVPRGPPSVCVLVEVPAGSNLALLRRCCVRRRCRRTWRVGRPRRPMTGRAAPTGLATRRARGAATWPSACWPSWPLAGGPRRSAAAAARAAARRPPPRRWGPTGPRRRPPQRCPARSCSRRSAPPLPPCWCAWRAATARRRRRRRRRAAAAWARGRRPRRRRRWRWAGRARTLRP